MITLDRLPKWLFCIPFVLQWLWLGIRYGSLTLPSVVNPRIENGGLAGESKVAYLRQIDRRFADWIVPTVAITGPALAEDMLTKQKIHFPVVAKPDIGWCGYGVRRLADRVELAAYAAAFPRGATFLLQPLIESPCEAALFYVRDRDADRGVVTSVTIRQRAFVTGDGIRTLAQLIAEDSVQSDRNYSSFSASDLRRTPGAGEIVHLTTVASLRVGGRYEDAARLITPRLTDAVDHLCRSMGAFHWGRIDVKFVSETELCAGRFTVFEIDGAGSKAIHC